jgi:signal peptidase II
MGLLGKVAARRAYFALSLLVIALDQATKIAAHARLAGRGAVEIVPFFNLWYSRNPGGLFGYFRDLPDPWRTALLTALPVVAIAFIVGFIARPEHQDRATLSGLGLILGGATGNLIDRVFRGEVVDFLDVYVPPGALADRLHDWFGTAHWPTFNVADSAIVVGAGLLLLDLVRPQSRVPLEPEVSPQGAGPDRR